MGKKEKLTQLEEKILCGPTWATESMTFRQRLTFFRDTGEWPGLHSKAVTEMLMQGNIDAERAKGKIYCANQKLKRAKEARLEIK